MEKGEGERCHLVHFFLFLHLFIFSIWGLNPYQEYFVWEELRKTFLNIIPIFLCSYLSLSLPGAALGVTRPASFPRQDTWGRGWQAALNSHTTLLVHVQRYQQIQRRLIRCFKEVQRVHNPHSLINTWCSIWGGYVGPLVAGDLGKEDHGSRRTEVCSPFTDPWAKVWEGLTRPPPSHATSPCAVTMQRQK